MGIGSVGNVNYSPQKTGGSVAKLEQQLQSLTKKLEVIEGNDKLSSEEKQEQIREVKKQIAQIEKQIARMKRENKASEEVQKENATSRSHTHKIDEYI